ncbi:hypothetical protein G6O69_11205 [Pseudenhygromyxa sp. WMMC2535]|uniref:FG-GAP repeat protein n=1 Tax=Pseudenhygromyxa sp. WMMC2535 TaxID=2712867 RepID=UPI001551E221|nr:FG-GAP repeat protein [Pseudenhygromyxa sp. WMMC2535]NVB38399.1 hypothetical protein [Pseudenhygromyxa sp. WMMC2535]
MKPRVSALLGALAACGGCYDTDAFPPDDQAPPCGFADPQLELEVEGPGRFRLRWTADPSGEVGHEQLIAHGPAGAAVLALDPALPGEHTLAAPLHFGRELGYELRQCEDQACACVDTHLVAPTAAQLRAAIDTLAPADLEADNTFGTALSLDRDASHLAVGAPFMNADGEGVGLGSVRVYAWDAQLLGYQPEALPLPDNLSSERRYGFSVAMDAAAEVMLVGAPGGAGIEGRAYLFVRDADQAWTLNDASGLSDEDTSGRFGLDVAVSADGDTIAVGAPRAGEAGEVAVYFRDTSLAWKALPSVELPAALASGDGFGSALALDASGRRLAIAAPRQDALAEDGGAVYLYERDASGQWQRELEVGLDSAMADDRFGSDLALDGAGDLLVASAPGRGALLLCCQRESAWTCEQRELPRPEGLGEDDELGSAIALSQDGQVLAVAARKDDSALAGLDPIEALAAPGEPEALADAAADAGAVHVYPRLDRVGPACGFASPAGELRGHYVKAPAPAAYDQFGRALAVSEAGESLAVGAYKRDGAGEAQANQGAAYVY